jgi:hypothetical protein
MSVTFRQEIRIPEDTRKMVAACQDKRGLGMAIAGEMDRQNELTVTAIRGKLTGTLLRRRTGNLGRSIGQTDALVISSTEGTEVRSSVGSGVGTGAKAVSYAAPLEFGSKPHLIRPLPGRGPRGSLRFIGRGGQIVFAKEVHHPGNRAYYFVRDTIKERLLIYKRAIGGTVFNFLRGGADNE